MILIDKRLIEPSVKSRTDLLGENKKSTDVINRTAGLDNYGVVGLQRQIMKGTLI